MVKIGLGIAAKTPGMGILTARQAQGFTPASISGLLLWLDAGYLTGYANGDTVALWPDLSGNGYSAFQDGGASLCPTYRTNIFNGKPVLRFDSTDDSLATTLDVNINTYSVFCVYAPKSSGFLSRKTVKFSSGSFVGPDGTNHRAYVNGSPFAVVSTVPLVTNQPAINIYRVGSTVGNILVTRTGGVTTTATSTAYAAPRVVTIGQLADQDLAAVAIYNKTISTTERDNLIDYAKNRWGIS